jgi:hypothetical protein
MGQKWLGEELLKFYTFIIFNFKFVISRHLCFVLDPSVDSVSTSFPPIQDNPVDSDPEDPQETNKEASQSLVPKRRPMSNQFYKDMLDYITKSYGNPNKRMISHLRCKMSKFFGSKETTEVGTGEILSPTSSNVIRWKNSIINFEDLRAIYQLDPTCLLMSDKQDSIQKPNQMEEEIIRSQIEKQFGIYLKIKEAATVNNFLLNKIDWPVITPHLYLELKQALEYYTYFGEHIKRCEEWGYKKHFSSIHKILTKLRQVNLSSHKALQYANISSELGDMDIPRPLVSDPSSFNTKSSSKSVDSKPFTFAQ